MREVTPKIMTLIKNRTESLLMDINRVNPHDQALKVLHQITTYAGRIADNAVMGSRQHAGHLGAPF